MDWVLTVADSPPTDLESQWPLNRGAFEALLPEFSKYANRWFELSTCPPMQRVAFGAVLLYPEEDRKSGYELFSKLLPVKIDAENSSDFEYAINRPRSNIIGLTINRLSRWSVVSRTLHRITPTTSGAKSIPLQSEVARRLELDINTVPDDEQDDIRREGLVNVFSKLVELGAEIAEKGDIP